MRIKHRVVRPDGSKRDYEEGDYSQAIVDANATPGSYIEKRLLYYFITDDPFGDANGPRRFDWSDDADAERDKIINPVIEAAQNAFPKSASEEVIGYVEGYEPPESTEG